MQGFVAGIAGLSLAVVVVASSAAFAQSGDITYELDNQRVEIESLRTIEAIRSLTPDVFALACPGVVYEDILADPDNTALNICFARLMIEQEQYALAQSTLERLLLIDPDFVEARYVYALLLFRMGNTTGAEQALAVLEESDLTRQDRAAIAGLRAAIEDSGKRLHQTLTFSIGAHYDTNRNAAPSSKSLLGLGTAFPITASEDLAQHDVGFLGILDYGFVYQPDWQGGHTVIGSATAYVDDQVKVDTSDLTSLSLTGGLGLNMLGGLVTPLATYSNVRLDGEHILSASGASLRYDRLLESGMFDRPIGTFAEVRWADESYHNNNDSTVLVEQDGRRLRLNAGVVLPLADSHILRLAFGFADKDADASYRAYQGYELSADYTWLPGNSQFLITSLSAARNDFDAADPLVSGTPGIVRRDDIYRVRLTYGLTVGDILGLESSDGLLAETLGAMTWTVTAEHLKQNSNVINYDYKNTRLQTMLSRSWSF